MLLNALLGESVATIVGKDAQIFVGELAYEKPGPSSRRCGHCDGSSVTNSTPRLVAVLRLTTQWRIGLRSSNANVNRSGIPTELVTSSFAPSSERSRIVQVIVDCPSWKAIRPPFNVLRRGTPRCSSPIPNPSERLLERKSGAIGHGSRSADLVGSLYSVLQRSGVPIVPSPGGAVAGEAPANRQSQKGDQKGISSSISSARGREGFSSGLRGGSSCFVGSCLTQRLAASLSCSSFSKPTISSI